MLGLNIGGTVQVSFESDGSVRILSHEVFSKQLKELFAEDSEESSQRLEMYVADSEKRELSFEFVV